MNSEFFGCLRWFLQEGLREKTNREVIVDVFSVVVMVGLRKWGRRMLDTRCSILEGGVEDLLFTIFYLLTTKDLFNNEFHEFSQILIYHKRHKNLITDFADYADK